MSDAAIAILGLVMLTGGAAGLASSAVWAWMRPRKTLTRGTSAMHSY